MGIVASLRKGKSGQFASTLSLVLKVCYCTAYQMQFLSYAVTFSFDYISSFITGSGKYIYIEASNPAKVNRSAQLLSPLIRGPKCLSFYYHIYRHGIGNLDVSLQIRDQPGAYLMWRKSGEQSDQWMKASVDIGYTGECQVGKAQKSAAVWEDTNFS